MINKIINFFKEYNSRDDEERRTEKLYAVSAIYDTPNDIMTAASEVASRGYEKFDAFTPYPVHRLDSAMGIKYPLVGPIAFTGGILGCFLALLMMWWMGSKDYPNIIGGKPFFSLPPSIPITFEGTVLLTGFATIIGMLIILNKLPKINTPISDTEFMRRVSSDKFGIVITADDKLFSESEVTALLKSLGASKVENIYYKPSNLTDKTPIFDKKFIMTLIGTAAVTALVSYFTLNYVLYNVVPFDWMWKQARINSQSQSLFFANKSGMREPVAGTVARGFMPYEYKGLPDSAVKLLANPLPSSKQVLERGQDKFNIYCSPCHGYFGDGDGRMNNQFPVPPSLHNNKVLNWKDGNIYHVITNGQNVMPSYESQISRDDRWAIIHYIRALQRAKNAKDEDLPK
jgi:mono/diheme cytochrome c family protein